MDVEEADFKNIGADGDESEAVVLLGVGTGEEPHLKGTPQKAKKCLINTATPDFIDELEDVLSNTDKLFVKESQPIIPPGVFSNFDVATVYEVLNGQGERGFLLGRCREKGSLISFVIVTNSGHGVLNFKQYGLFGQHFEIEGAGILSFNQVKNCCGGYTLQDRWKRLLQIRPSWIEFCTFCLFSPGKTATMEFVNLDGTPSGTLSYKKWINLGFEDRTLCVHFIPQLDRKAKYMVFAASLMPFTSYFIEPGRSNNSILLIVFYAILLVIVVIGIIVLSII